MPTACGLRRPRAPSWWRKRQTLVPCRVANVDYVIPLPGAARLAGAMLVGTTVGMVAAIASALFIKIQVRPDVAIALVIGVPCVVGLVLVLLSVKRWMTTVGAFVLAVGPGWLSALVAIRAVHGV